MRTHKENINGWIVYYAYHARFIESYDIILQQELVNQTAQQANVHLGFQDTDVDSSFVKSVQVDRSRLVALSRIHEHYEG